MVVRIGPGPDPGWLVAAVGIGMTVVGWYQISGQPTEAQQLPYLASATIPGSALIVAGSVMIAARRMAGARRGGGERQFDGYDTVRYGGQRQAGDGRLWALPGGNYVHRADCPLIDGKTEAFEVTAEVTADGGAPTRPCPICDPDVGALGGPRAVGDASDTVGSDTAAGAPRGDGSGFSGADGAEGSNAGGYDAPGGSGSAGSHTAGPDGAESAERG